MRRAARAQRETRKELLLDMLVGGVEVSAMHPDRVYLTQQSLISLGDELVREQQAKWEWPFLRARGG